jgi:hypothetical protein
VAMLEFKRSSGGAVAQLGARLDGIEEVVGSNPIGSTILQSIRFSRLVTFSGYIIRFFAANGY